MKRADPCLQTIAVGRISIVSCRTDTCLQTVERPVLAERPCPLPLWVNRHKEGGGGTGREALGGAFTNRR